MSSAIRSTTQAPIQSCQLATENTETPRWERAAWGASETEERWAGRGQGNAVRVPLGELVARLRLLHPAPRNFQPA